ILVGINVDEMFAETQRKGLLYFGDDEKAKSEFLKWFLQDIREARYSEAVEKGILQFVEDLISGRIEVRAHNSKAIHAKFYIFLPETHTAHSDGWVIMGSSNLTMAGLGIKKAPNYELNIALKDFDDVEFSKNEFAALWAESTTILPGDIQAFKEKSHIGQTFTPFELYIKFLIEYFGKNIDYDPDTIGDLPKNFRKLSYQVDAVNQGFQMLLDHDGFFLADVVGLGKTVVAATIAKRFLIANGSQNTKILVVYPPAVEKNWKRTFRDFQIDKHAKFITNSSLEKITAGNNPNFWPKEDYDLILVDEAHRYRNHTSEMFDQLQRICKSPRINDGSVPGDKKKVVLISATPLNNRPQDLYHQLLLFQDARRSTLTPITNLQTFFGPKIREYRDIIRDEDPDLDRIREIYKEIRERVLTPITVRRTRKDLDKYPKYKDDLEEQGIHFPEINSPIAKEYKLEGDLGDLFAETMFRLTSEDHINYFRYQAISALNEDLRDEYYPQARLVSNSLAGILRTLMVKRLESSFHAFRRSLTNIVKATDRMIKMFEDGKVFIAPDLNINDLMEKGWTVEEIELFILEKSIDDPNTRNRVFESDDFEPDFLNGLRKDSIELHDLVNKWNDVDVDPKLETFFASLSTDFLHSTRNPTGKLVIFTESKDTADYLHEKLERHLETKILNISATNRNKFFETIQENFDANYLESQKNDFNILITTDVLAEGVNLHRANVLINYDTPWNATRLMQRIGRVNRIGSVAGTIYSYNFYPSPQGDKLIRLYNNALVKLQSFHSAYGEDAQIFTHEELVQQFEMFKEGANDEEDKRLLYLRQIRQFKDTSPNEFKRIKQFPLKARTARRLDKANKETVEPSTVVFLKSPYKSEFYSVDSEDNATALTFLETAQIFEAVQSEPPFPLPDHHYVQVQAALDTFERDFFGSATETVSTTDLSDGRSNQARKFLRDHRGMSKLDEVKVACSVLIELVEKGTFTVLPNEIKKLKQQIEKQKIAFNQSELLILKLATKYGTNASGGEATNGSREIEANIEPEIVLSETFFH
ncbi:MAG: helicase-related protein, partial [Pyrinomonadaceae bacterium]